MRPHCSSADDEIATATMRNYHLKLTSVSHCVAAIACLVLGKGVWEVEVRMCSKDGRVWPLHVVWHFLSCASSYYGLLADLASRIDCGISTVDGHAVPLDWVGVPFTEVRVMHAPVQERGR